MSFRFTQLVEKTGFSFFTTKVLLILKFFMKGRYLLGFHNYRLTKVANLISVLLFIFHDAWELQGCDTVFATPTARTIDIAHAWIMVILHSSLAENWFLVPKLSYVRLLLKCILYFTENGNHIGGLSSYQGKNN